MSDRKSEQRLTTAVVLRRKGFTIIELMVVIAIAGILIAMLLPAVQRARETARRIQCSNNLRQLGIALHNYQSAHSVFPPSRITRIDEPCGECDEDEVPVEDDPSECSEYQSWTALALPWIEQAAIAARYDYESPWCSLANRPFVSRRIALFECPSTPDGGRTDDYHVRGAAVTDYAAVVEIEKPVFTEVFGVPEPGQVARRGLLTEYSAARPRDVQDGMSNTIMLAERAGNPSVFVFRQRMTLAQFEAYAEDEIIERAGGYVVENGAGWADPDTGLEIEGTQEDGVTPFGGRFINAINTEAYSFHTGGAQFLFGDGSVHFLSDSIDSWTFVSLSTRAGREVIGEF